MTFVDDSRRLHSRSIPIPGSIKCEIATGTPKIIIVGRWTVAATVFYMSHVKHCRGHSPSSNIHKSPVVTPVYSVFCTCRGSHGCRGSRCKSQRCCCCCRCRCRCLRTVQIQVVDMVAIIASKDVKPICHITPHSVVSVRIGLSCDQAPERREESEFHHQSLIWDSKSRREQLVGLLSLKKYPKAAKCNSDLVGIFLSQTCC